jgi:hypothetical protein
MIQQGTGRWFAPHEATHFQTMDGEHEQSHSYTVLITYLSFQLLVRVKFYGSYCGPNSILL